MVSGLFPKLGTHGFQGKRNASATHPPTRTPPHPHICLRTHQQHPHHLQYLRRVHQPLLLNHHPPPPPPRPLGQEIQLRALLAVTAAEVLVRDERQRGADEDEGVDADTEAGGRGSGLGFSGGGVGRRGGGGGVAGLSKYRGHGSVGRRGVCGGWVVVRTSLFRLPISRPLRISRASSLWPTSSKASEASWPPTSIMTSSPPLPSHNI